MAKHTTSSVGRISEMTITNEEANIFIGDIDTGRTAAQWLQYMIDLEQRVMVLEYQGE